MVSRHSVLVGFAAVLAGACTSGSGHVDEGSGQLDGRNALSSPTHAALSAWSFPDSAAVLGQGACAGTTLSAFLDSVRP
jgi:hypothetical protein